MINNIRFLCAAAAVAVIADDAPARDWTDITGKYHLEADLVGFDDETVVVQRADKELGAFPIDKLSQKDREFLQTKEATQANTENVGKLQTWTMQSGLKVVGRVVDYVRRDLTVQRRRGKVYANDKTFDNLPEVYQRMLPKIVAHFEENVQPDKAGLEAWLRSQKGKPRKYTLEGVLMELENGDEYGIPFFFFSADDLKVLQPGWDAWLKVHEDPEQSDDHAFRLQSLAAAYQQNQRIDRQIAIMQLNMQAIQAGLVAAWEVSLYPGPGVVGPPLWVVVPARNSAAATAIAMQQNPGYVAGAQRRLSYR
jgi:hypothetical protein